MLREDRLIVALDVIEPRKAEYLADLLSPYVTTFKVGWQLFLSGGKEIVEIIRKKGEVFLDLKLYDIPFQVGKAIEVLSQLEPRFLTISLFGGPQMVKQAVESARNFSSNKLILLGVTVLTSLEEEDLRTLGIECSTEESVLKLAKMSVEAGLNGLVASPKEAGLIKANLSPEIVVVTPGIRLTGEAMSDQKRASSVKSALENGADFLVVGRPIIEASDPVDKLSQYLEEVSKWKT